MQRPPANTGERRIEPPDPRRWPRVEALFEATLDLPPDERAERLAACDDERVRREVERLLAADGEAGGFLETSGDAARPERIGPYLIQGELGRGGMGVVYLAHDPELDRPVAIKSLSSKLAPADFLDRLEREARILASFSHPNIATIYRLERIGGDRHLILEYVPGENLRERLAAGPLRLRETLRVAVQIAAALAAAHDQGVVHRDLKPENVRITPQGQVKVLDFGLAKPLLPSPDEPGRQLTRSGAILGTVSYMSPEQAAGDKVDQRTDVWAFGCVLFECLSGRRAFAAETTWRTLDAIASTDPDWQALPARVPPRVERLLRRSLRKDPEDRLRDMGDVRLELAELAAELSDSATGVLPRTRSRGPARRILAGAAIATLLAAAGIAWVAGRPAAAPSVPASRAVRLEVELPPIKPPVFNLGRPLMAVSPDGDRLVVCGEEGLWVRDLGEFAPVLLPGTAGAVHPFFSPDGRSIGYSKGRRVYRIALDAGVPIPLTEARVDLVGASWGDDGTIVMAIQWQGGLWRIPEGGGEPEPLTRLDPARAELSHRWPQVLPGGRGVVYTVKTPEILSFDDAKIAVLDLATGEQKVLLEGGTAPFYLPDGHLLYVRGRALHGVPFDLDRLAVTGAPKVLAADLDMDPVTGMASVSISRDGTLVYLPPFERRDRAADLMTGDRGGRRERLAVLSAPEEGRLFGFLSLSGDGRRLAVPAISANNSVWIYDLERGTFGRLIQELGNAHHPIWNPDGENVTFLAEKAGERALVRLRTDGAGGPEVLVRDAALDYASSWSPDGSALIYGRIAADTGRDLWILPAGGAPEPFLASRFDEVDAAFSPDGAWVAYTSDETGRFEVFVRPAAAPGPKLQVSSEGGRNPLWSSAGSEVYFRRTTSVMAAAVELGATPRIGEPRELFEVSERAAAVMAHDGRRFLWLEYLETPPPPDHARVVLHWLDELRW